MSAEIKYWVNKHDFKGVVPRWATSTPDEYINSHISDVIIYSLKLKLPAALFTALQTLIESNPVQWDRTTEYVLNDKILWNNSAWKCLIANDGSEPASANANWIELNLWNIWRDHLKKYVIWAAYAKYLTWHGTFVSQSGVRKINEVQSDPVTPEERATVVNASELMADKVWRLFMQYMSSTSINYVIDTVTYNFSESGIKQHKLKTRMRIV